MNRSRTLFIVLAVLLALTSFSAAVAAPAELADVAGVVQDRPARGNVVVADRGSGTISVIDVATDQVSATVALPAGPNAPEPMYVVYSNVAKRVFVGDRANDRVVVFNPDDWSVEATVGAGAGVFHMWIDPQDKHLWVNNDVDNTATVIDPKTLEVLATVPMPADLVSMGGKPHDVVLDTRYAYVTMLGFAGSDDYVVKFDKRTLAEVGRAPVGKDPHVSLTLRNHLLYVPAQNSNELRVLDRRTLDVVTTLDIPGAHGAGMTSQGKTFYTTNLTGGGTDALSAIDTKTNTVIGSPVDAPAMVPHNIALTPDGSKLYVTHSGAASDLVSIYTADRHDPTPVLVSTVTVGLNPFGLAYVP
ncbi:MAG: beta-propeller fold lactonase family protein [Caldilineales bacterium]